MISKFHFYFFKVAAAEADVPDLPSSSSRLVLFKSGAPSGMVATFALVIVFNTLVVLTASTICLWHPQTSNAKLLPKIFLFFSTTATIISTHQVLLWKRNPIIFDARTFCCRVSPSILFLTSSLCRVWLFFYSKRMDGYSCCHSWKWFGLFCRLRCVSLRQRRSIEKHRNQSALCWPKFLSTKQTNKQFSLSEVNVKRQDCTINNFPPLTFLFALQSCNCNYNYYYGPLPHPI